MPERKVKLIKSAAASDPFGNVSVVLYLEMNLPDGKPWHGCCARRESLGTWEGLLGKLRTEEPAKPFSFGDLGMSDLEGPVTDVGKTFLARDAAGWLDRLLHTRVLGAEEFLKKNDSTKGIRLQTDYGMESLFSIPTGRWFQGRNLAGRERRKKRIIY